MFQQIDAYLSGAFSDHYWSDEGISACTDLIDEFSDEDWAALNSALLLRPPRWQQRCAEVLGETPATHALPMLVQLCRSEDAQVIEAALDSINALQDLDTAALVPHAEEFKALIEGLLPNAGAAVRPMLESMQAKLGKMD